MVVILINISDLSWIGSHSNCCWVQKAKGIAQGWAMHRWFQSPAGLSHSSLHWNPIFHRKRSTCLKLRGWRRHWDAWIADIHPFTERTGCSGGNTCQGMAFSTITVLLMPASENWQLQPLNKKSVHNYRGVKSAAWSHIIMAFPNWEVCSAKSHCSQCHLHWSLSMKKKRSISIFCFVQYHLFPALLQERPSGTCLTLPGVGSD